MFNFQEELSKFRESLTLEDLSGGVSGDEVRDILDIAKQLVEAGPAPAVKPRPAAPKVKTEVKPTQVPKQGASPRPGEVVPKPAKPTGKEIMTASSGEQKA